MSRRIVRCPCGGEFPIPEVTPSLLHCPYCGEPVRYRAAGDPGGSFKVREEIKEPLKPVSPGNPWYPLYLLGGGGLVLAAALIGLVFLFSDREVVRHPAFEETVKGKPRQKVEETFTSIQEIPLVQPTPKKPEVPSFKLAPPPIEAQFDEFEGMARAQRLSTRMNLMGIVSTFYFLSNRAEEHRQLQGSLSKEDTEFRQLLPYLGDKPEFQPFKEHIRPGDVMTAFGTVSLDASRPKPFVDAIRDWLILAQAGANVMVAVQREGRSILMPLWFLEIPADLLPTEMRPLAPAVPAITRALPAELLAEAKQRVAALHPFYRKGLAADDVTRLEALVAASTGTVADVEFLRNRILAYCSRCEAERTGFETKVAALEGLLAQAQTTDTLVFKDGRKVQGQIEEETPEYVRLKGRFGAIRSPKTEILRVDRGDPFGVEFRRRYDAARGKVSELVSVLAWCREKNLTQHRDLAAYAILKDDPANDAAWTALGVTDRAAPTGPEFDVVWLKDGTKREGIITGENEASIQIDLVVRGTKAETIGTGKASISRSDIARIDRMNDAARKRAKDRAVSFTERTQKTQEALAGVIVVPDGFAGFSGHRSPGTLFELHSTVSPQQVRETAHMLEEMFNAFRRHFSIRRNAAKKIDVYFLANSAEYAAFQQATRGGVSPNPAYFDTRANHVAAYYGVQKDDESRIRANILASEREIEDYKRKIAAEEDRIAKAFRALRQSVLDEIAAARRGAGEDPKAQAALDRNKQESLNMIKAQERSAMEYLGKLRRDANQSIQQHEALIRHNQAVLVNQTRAMYEILFHESFHAFAANFLWEEADNAGLPRWLHEGMASYYERSVVEAGDLVHGGVHPSFLALLRNQQQNNALIPVATLVAAGADLFQIQHTGEIPRQEMAYAHAWGLAHYLMSRGVSRDRLEAYVVDLSAGKSRIAAFEALAGKKIGDVEAEWRVHLSSLRGP